VGSRYKRCCPHCDHKVKNLSNLKIHIDSKHPEHDEKNHFCDKCEIGFIFLESLSEHKRKKHSKYVCEQCGASYKTQEAYKVWQYRLWSFQRRDTKLERCLAKNQL
jgi:hypothetical protein